MGIEMKGHERAGGEGEGGGDGEGEGDGDGEGDEPLAGEGIGVGEGVEAFEGEREGVVVVFCACTVTRSNNATRHKFMRRNISRRANAKSDDAAEASEYVRYRDW